jgi:hypothetical protein
MDADHDLLTQSDHLPVGGAYPTSFWDAGDIIHDSHRLTLRDTAASGAGTLLIGMYNPETGIRLPAYKAQDGTRFKNDIVVAGGVTIE